MPHSADRTQTQTFQNMVIPASWVGVLRWFRDNHEPSNAKELRSTFSRYGRGTEGSSGHQIKSLD